MGTIAAAFDPGALITDHVHRDATEVFLRCQPTDGTAKCYAIFVFAVDSGAVQGAWIDCKHQNTHNEAPDVVLYTY